MSMASTNIATGAEVFTMDGHKLGTVKMVEPDHFKVSAPMQPDYWLPCDCVDGGGGMGGRVTVSFSKDSLDSYKEEEHEEGM